MSSMERIAVAISLKSWSELPVHVRRSDRLLYKYIRLEVMGDSPTDVLNVIVTDSGSVAIAGATVTIGSLSETTGSDGVASFELEYGDYEATISADGFETYTDTLQFRSNHKNFTVTLESSGGSSGTLTVTAVDSEQTPLENSLIFATDEQYNDIVEFLDAMEQDPTIVLGYGLTDNTGEALLMTMGEEWQPVEPVINFEAGTHYIYAVSSGFDKVYAGTVSINGDTTTTITLTAPTTDFTFAIYQASSGGEPVESGTMHITGNTETDQTYGSLKEYEITQSSEMNGELIWLSSSAVADGTTRNQGYYQEDNEFFLGNYFTFEAVSE